MPASGSNPLARRDFLAGAVVAAGALALPAGASGQVADGPVQRLLVLSVQNAFARLTMPDGFWNSRVARFGLPVLFRKTSGAAPGPLGSDVFREQLQHRLNNLAESGARGAAAGPAVASVIVYLLMAVVLFVKPEGLFPARG